MKLLVLPILVLPAIASAQPVADVHVGGSEIGVGGDASVESGPGVFADAEAGWRIRPFDITAFTSYATRHVDTEEPDIPTGTSQTFMHFRLHVLDLGARVTVRGEHAYGGLGLALEDEIERGTDHVSGGAMAGDRVHDMTDLHPAVELRGGFALANHLDVSAAMTLASAYSDSLVTVRVGVGYRF